MRRSIAGTALVLAATTLAGCSLPRGPIIVDPLVPRWLSHGEVTCECPDDPILRMEQIPSNSAGIQPPVSKFHPVPTRPVFESRGGAAGETIGL